MSIAFEVGRSKFDKVATLGVEHIGQKRESPRGWVSTAPTDGD